MSERVEEQRQMQCSAWEVYAGSLKGQAKRERKVRGGSGVRKDIYWGEVLETGTGGRDR